MNFIEFREYIDYGPVKRNQLNFGSDLGCDPQQVSILASPHLLLVVNDIEPSSVWRGSQMCSRWSITQNFVACSLSHESPRLLMITVR